MRSKFLVLSLLLLNACASAGPTVHAICATCQGICPLIGGLSKIQCPEGTELVVANWKQVEKGTELARVVCKDKRK